MKFLLFLIAFLLLSSGCGRSDQQSQEPPKMKIETPAPVKLRDPFRPDHPTREQVEAEKERKELEKE